jgi:anti-sigma B factor antagonist
MSQHGASDGTHLPADDLLVIDPRPGEITLRGEIDMGNASLLEEGLTNSVVDGRPLVVDMSGVTFLDSTGLRTIVNFRNSGHQVIVRHPSTQVLRLLQLTALEGVLQVERTTTQLA